MYKNIRRYIKPVLWLLFCSLVMFELFFLLRIAAIYIIPLQSTAFERTAAVELLQNKKIKNWKHDWVAYENISAHIKRAVIASEDSRFDQHYGVEWEAIVQAWRTNQEKKQKPNGRKSIRGGSTITQQLAKNIFLSPEQTYLRKAQELYITFALESLLSKERLLELYLNHAQWGDGVYGIQAASSHYYKTNAQKMTAQEAALLAGMLPRPMYYDKQGETPYLKRRANRIRANMALVSLP